MKCFEFDDLQVGQALKISGKFREGVGFLAVEILLEPAIEDDEIAAPLQGVDLQRQSVRLFNCDISLPAGMEIKDLKGNRVALNALTPGVMVKLKGAYDEAAGFVPQKIKIRETLEFNIEELQGAIDKIDRTRKRLQVNGIPVVVNANTVIESD